MSDREAIKLVEKTILKIKAAKNNKELEKIPGELSFRFSYDERKYPPLTFEFSNKEIKSIETIFSKDQGVAIDIQPLLKDPITKLLYALVWKQGDLIKLNAIADGLTGTEPESNRPVIFHQFGKHLANREEPIVDQHVLRAFAVSTVIGDISKVAEIRKKNNFDFDLINSYKEWFKKTKLSEHNSGTILDHIMFGLGKTIKSSLK